MLRSAGDEAERRLITQLKKDSWSANWISASAVWHRRIPYARKSELRDGNAYKHSWTVPVPAQQVFEVVQKRNNSSSWDPGCNVAFSSPVEEGTFVRYLIFSTLKICRDFYCVCRCSRVQVPLPEPASAPAGASEPTAPTKILLTQAEGHPAVRVFEEPRS